MTTKKRQPGLGRLQDVIGQAKSTYLNDRDANRADKLIPLLDEAFEIVLPAALARMEPKEMSDVSKTWEEEWKRWTGFSHSEPYDLDASETSQRDIARHFFDRGVMRGLQNATRHLTAERPPRRKR